MTKEDWIRKLTSRKFWAAIVAFVTGLLLYLGQDAQSVERIAALIMAGASVVAYIIGEGLIDAARENSSEYYIEPEERPPEDDLA